MSIYNEVVGRLKVLGFEVTENPDTAVTYAINRAAEKIKADINCSTIPNGLHYTWVDMAAGFYLFDKKAAGQLGDAFDFTAPAKRITEGDISVEFSGASDGSSTPEARFDKMIDDLINPPQSVFAAFRRLKW